MGNLMLDAAALRRLVELAEKADRFSDSPWESRDGSVYDNCGPVVVTNKNIRGAQSKAIAAFIAACDPQTIITLVKLAEAGAATGAGATPTCGAETPMRPTVVEGDQPAPALDAERRDWTLAELATIGDKSPPDVDLLETRGLLDLVRQQDYDFPLSCRKVMELLDSIIALRSALRASGTRP